MAELAERVERLAKGITAQQVNCAAISGKVSTALENLGREVSHLNRSLTGGNGERSIHSRLAVIEDKVARIEQGQKIRVAHTIALVCALLGAIWAILAVILT